MGYFMKALVIDDNIDSRISFTKALARLGCNVNDVDSSEDGITELSLNPYNVVFAALCVKKLGARGVARWIRDNCPATKFFLITSWKGHLDKHILNVEGIDGIIHKPLLFNEIRDTLLDHLG
jgi:CheY-like chemotaxis protein